MEKEKINLEGGKAVTQHHGNTIDTVKNNKYFWFFLLLAIPLAFYMRFVFFSVFGSDDLAYAKNALDIANGNFKTQAHPFYNRIGLILPVAILYKLFGFNEYISMVYPFLCSLINIGLVFISGALFFNIRVGILAVILLSFLPLDVALSTILIPDLPASTFISICSIIFLYCEMRSVKWESILYFISGLSIGWAYLTKEYSLFFGIFLFVYVAISVFKKRAKFGWIYLGIGILLPIMTELTYYFFKTGNILYRIHAIETTHNVSVWSGIHYHGYTLLKRMFFDLLNVLLENRVFGFNFFFVFAGMTLVILEKRKQKELWYFVLWFGVMFLSLNFCPTSLKSYNLLQLVDRYMYLFICPSIILSGYYLNRLYEEIQLKRLYILSRKLIISLAVPLIVMIIFNIVKYSLSDIVFISIIILAISILYLLPFIQYSCTKWFGLGIVGLFVFFNIAPSIYMTLRHLINNPCNGRNISAFIKELPPKLIYADDRTKSILEYLDGFKKNIKIESFYEKNVNEIGNSYVIVDKDYLFYANKIYQKEMPSFLDHPPRHWNILKHFNTIENYGCTIYEVGDKIFFK